MSKRRLLLNENQLGIDINPITYVWDFSDTNLRSPDATGGGLITIYLPDSISLFPTPLEIGDSVKMEVTGSIKTRSAVGLIDGAYISLAVGIVNFPVPTTYNYNSGGHFKIEAQNIRETTSTYRYYIRLSMGSGVLNSYQEKVVAYSGLSSLGNSGGFFKARVGFDFVEADAENQLNFTYGSVQIFKK